MSPPRTVAVDANVLINLAHVERMDLLRDLPGFEFAVPEQVVEEVTKPAQARQLEEALLEGFLRREEVRGAERASYTELRQYMGRGEAACLAIAESRGWLIASDERRRFLRFVRERLGDGAVLNTPGLLVLAIRAGQLSAKEADRAKEILERHRFKMKIESFDQFSKSTSR